MRIENTRGSIPQLVPSTIENLPRIVGKINNLAIPIIVLLALAYVPVAQAGPISYSACVTACTTVGGPFSILGCMKLCLPFLSVPAP